MTDALIRRALDLAQVRSGDPIPKFAWLALGSHARREAVPSSDLYSGIVWADTSDGDVPQTLAHETLETLTATGVKSDAHGLTATGSLVANAARDWRRNITTWLDEPAEDNAVMALSIVLDHRRSTAPHTRSRPSAICAPSTFDLTSCACCSDSPSPSGHRPASSGTS